MGVWDPDNSLGQNWKRQVERPESLWDDGTGGTNSS